MIDGFIRDPDEVDYLSVTELEDVRIIDSSGTNPATLMITTKRYAGTDTASSVKLKEVTIRAKKTAKPSPSNLYGTDHPYTITGERLAQYGSNRAGVTTNIAAWHYSRGGKFSGLFKKA